MMGYVVYAVLVAMERTKCSKSAKFLPHYKVDLAIVQIMVFFIMTFSSLLSWCFIYPVLKKKDPSLPDFRAASQYTFFCFTIFSFMAFIFLISSFLLFSRSELMEWFQNRGTVRKCVLEIKRLNSKLNCQRSGSKYQIQIKFKREIRRK
ncbi:Hypothetical_protein [Hexamita inflata]|uniref:Hypothetical_protein n=1 Tax=Hexamita inflata TaxID=28002 RepID=A0AA86UT28_9EUKA|nr:Hypothetical protein HINF_LOCUS58215 [Hexamita inflata]